MEELKIGDIIKERYELVRFLGNGSFGEVWLAHDQLSGREVALKIYLTLDPAGIEEFQREYANTIDLSSPFLLTPEYFDVYGRRPFLVMKYCENGSSSKLVGNVTEEQLWQFIQDVANGLAVLHEQSDAIVHQDIKPDNILIDGHGRFLITDFGISKRLRATMRRQSKRDVSSGAMPYMAPERFDSNPRLNTASDIWSLGASIYELVMGELPFSGFGGAMQRNGAEMPSLPNNYSPALNEIMHRCLNPDAGNRPTAVELTKWTKSKAVLGKTSEDYHKTISNQSATIQESKSQADSVKSSSHSTTIVVLIVLAILLGLVIFVWKPFNSDYAGEVASQSIKTDSLAEHINETQLLTAEQLIKNSSCVTKDGQSVHFYKGAFYYKNDIYPVMVAFIVTEDHIQKVIYKNVTYGSCIVMSCQIQENEILLSGKDGNNDFTMLLSSGEDNRLLGTAIDGNKSMTVRLMPTDETFNTSNVGEKKTPNPYDLSTIAGAFISKYSNGFAPWNCLNGTSAKRLSNDLEDDKSAGGILMVPFSAPLTIDGKPLVANQLDSAIDWDIYLRGPNAGVSTIMFSAMPQYVELEDVAKMIAKSLNGSYLRRRDSDYSRDCVYLYSVSDMRLAIYCSFGAHGGTIEAVLGDPDSVNEYANNCM